MLRLQRLELPHGDRGDRARSGRGRQLEVEQVEDVLLAVRRRRAGDGPRVLARRALVVEVGSEIGLCVHFGRRCAGPL